MEKVITKTTIVIGSIAAGIILLVCGIVFGIFLLPFLPVYLILRCIEPTPSPKGKSFSFTSYLN
jgi:hypothetical protein